MLGAQEVATRSLGSAYARLVSFEAEPEIAAAKFTVDSDTPGAGDLEITTAKLPFYREFGGEDGEQLWFTQITGNYLHMEEKLLLPVNPELEERIDASWEGFGVLAEGGIVWPLGKHFALAPSLGLGVSRLENEFDFTTPAIEEALAPRLDGVLYNWDTLASVLRGSVALRYDRRFGNWRLKGSAHLSGSYVDSFEESSRFPGFSDEAGNFGAKFDVSHPLAWEIGDRQMFLVGHLGYTEFIGANRDELGFTRFGEAGASLGAGKFTLGLLGLLGDDVRGWNILFNYDY